MRPINSRHFGAKYGSLVVKFHNGTGVVDGFIKRQLGSQRFEVSDGVVSKVCDLAQTTDEAEHISGARMTIETADGKFVNKISAFKVQTTEDDSINWQDPTIETPVVSVFVAPEVVSPVVQYNKLTRFIKPNRPVGSEQINHGSGNRADAMTLAFNGEIEVAAAVRNASAGINYATSLITPVDNVYTANLTTTGREWTYVYSFGLVGTPTGALLTDLYDISLTLSRPEGGLTFYLRRRNNAYIFQLEDQDAGIIDDTTVMDGKVYQGIQRAKFYSAFFNDGEVPVTPTGAFLGQTDIALKAIPKGAYRGFAPVEISIIANAVVDAPPPPAPPQ